MVEVEIPEDKRREVEEILEGAVLGNWKSASGNDLLAVTGHCEGCRHPMVRLLWHARPGRLDVAGYEDIVHPAIVARFSEALEQPLKGPGGLRKERRSGASGEPQEVWALSWCDETRAQ